MPLGTGKRISPVEAWAEWTNEDENLWSSTSNDDSELAL